MLLLLVCRVWLFGWSEGAGGTFCRLSNGGDLERGAELWYVCSMVDYRNSVGDNEQGGGKDLKVRHNSLQVSIRLEPIMLKNLPIIPSRTSKKFTHYS